MAKQPEKKLKKTLPSNDSTSKQNPDVPDNTPENSDDNVNKDTFFDGSGEDKSGIGGVPDFDSDTGGGDSPEKENGEESDKNDIMAFNKKLKSLNKIKFQRNNIEEPDYKFNQLNDYVKQNYISITKNKSLLIAIPFDSNNNSLYIEQVLVPHIKNTIDYCKSNKKQLVYLSYFPISNDETDTESFVFNYIKKNYGNNLILDTWHPHEYKSFVSKDDVWNGLKSFTSASDSDIKTALFLYLLTRKNKIRYANKLKDDKVRSSLSKFGLDPNFVTLKVAIKLLYPELFEQEQNLYSFIIKVYNQLLKKEFILKLYKYEKKGITVISTVDKYLAWEMTPVVNNIKNVIKLPEKKTPKSDKKDAKQVVKKTDKVDQQPDTQKKSIKGNETSVDEPKTPDKEQLSSNKNKDVKSK